MDPFTMIVMAVIAITMAVISYALMPSPKSAQHSATQDLENPTAEAGRPIPVVFGTLTVKSGNILWFGEKGKREFEVDA